jgi:hypothetical protein
VAVRTAYAPVAASVLTAANLAKLPGGWIGYNEVTANQSTITSVVDLTSLTVTVTVGTGRRIRVSAHCTLQQNSAAGEQQLYIFEGAQIGISRITAHSGLGFYTHTPSVVLTPSSGSHTYKLRAAAVAGNLDLVASATAPAYILVEDIGATP